MSDTSSAQTTLNNNSAPYDDEDVNAIVNQGQGEQENNDKEEDEDEEEEDPLSVKQLSLNFEYLMYKINDRVKTLSEQTEDVIVEQKNQYDSDIERINKDLVKIDSLTKDYKKIMDEFVKLEQLSYIVKDFNSRLAEIESSMKEL